MKKKKIAIYYNLFFLGGVEQAILTLMKQLYRDYEFFVIYDDKDSSDYMLSKYKRYAKVSLLNDIDIDVDICICCSSVNDDKFTSRVRAEKYYAWVHAIMFKTYPGFSYSTYYRNIVDKFICVSDSVLEDMVTMYPELSNKIMVINNYIDVVEIQEKAEGSCDLEVDNDSLNIVTVARLSEEKGFHRIKALVNLFNKNNIKYNWYVLGTAYSKETENEIKEIFDKEDNVIFLGYKENPYPYIKQMDYLALLSDIEAWGLVVSEALALRVPCIVTDFKEAYSQIDESNGIILSMDTSNYEKYLLHICERKFDIINTDLIEIRNSKVMLEWKGIL